MNLIIIGPQGSGKGTQAKMIAKDLGLHHVESGKILRTLAKKDKRIKNIIDNGILVPDQETIDYIEKHLMDHDAGFDSLIFDGYPRSMDQYELLTRWLKSKNQDIEIVIFLNISEEESIKRLSSRRTCSKCGEVYNLITNPPPKEDACSCGGRLVLRDDDKPETIKKRLETFREQTIPIIEKARSEDKLLEIDGERPIDEIFEDIIARLKEKNVQ